MMIFRNKGQALKYRLIYEILRFATLRAELPPSGIFICFGFRVAGSELAFGLQTSFFVLRSSVSVRSSNLLSLVYALVNFIRKPDSCQLLGLPFGFVNFFTIASHFPGCEGHIVVVQHV